MNANDNIIDSRSPLETNDHNLIRATMTVDKHNLYDWFLR